MEPETSAQPHNLLVLVLPPGEMEKIERNALAARVVAELSACAVDLQPIMGKPWQFSFLLRGDIAMVEKALELVTNRETPFLIVHVGEPFATSALAGPLRWLQARQRSR